MNDELREALANGELPLMERCDEPTPPVEESHPL